MVVIVLPSMTVKTSFYNANRHNLAFAITAATVYSLVLHKIQTLGSVSKIWKESTCIYIVRLYCISDA
jgi:hypothetical protein